MTKQTEALKLALEALEIATTPLAKDRQEVLRARTAIREALAEQPAQTDWEAVAADQAMTIALLKAEQPAQPQQEPVAWITQNGKGWLRWHKPEDNNTDSVPLYTSPPAQRTWVGLTDEEIEKVWRRVQANDFHDCVQPFARAIEAKLKEKNT